MIVAVVLVIASVAIGATVIAKSVRARISPRELRGDWWSRFESEFRDYARHAAGAAHPRRGHDTPPR
jgi:hypothetical protein